MKRKKRKEIELRKFTKTFSSQHTVIVNIKKQIKILKISKKQIKILKITKTFKNLKFIKFKKNS